jgi:hypothetical protein
MPILKDQIAKKPNKKMKKNRIMNDQIKKKCQKTKKIKRR